MILVIRVLTKDPITKLVLLLRSLAEALLGDLGKSSLPLKVNNALTLKFSLDWGIPLDFHWIIPLLLIVNLEVGC